MGNPGLSNRDNGQQQLLGITEPISLGGPTEYDVIKTRELEKVLIIYLQDAGLYENQQEAEDFFGELHRMLSKMPEVTELHPVPDAHVPVMRFKFNGVYIDLLYAKLSLWDLDISQESILQNADEETVCSLNGCRVTDQVLCLIPNIQVTSYLGGINWALLVARTC
ncbi:Nuclear poly(A) polymerase 1 [Glycine soja]